MKKLISIVMVMAMLLGMSFAMPISADADVNPELWDGTVPTIASTDTLDTLFPNKDGDVYLLESAADVAELAAWTNAGNETLEKSFKLCCNIDINNQAWPGIGFDSANGAAANNATAFKGDFDGNGHVIFNLNLANTASGKITAGFFGWIASGAKVHDLGIASGNITATVAIGQDRFGTLVGAMGGNTTIENCFNAATMNATVNHNNIGIGGLVGQVNSENSTGTATIKNCWNAGTLNITPAAARYNIRVGGLVGDIVNSVTIQDTTNVGDVVYMDANLSNPNNCVGQIAGQVSLNGSVTCTNVQLDGDVKVASNVGSRGLVFGKFNAATLSATNVTYNTTAYGYNDGVFVVKDANAIATITNSESATNATLQSVDSITLTDTNDIGSNNAQNHRDGGKIRFNSELAYSYAAFSECGYVVEFGGKTVELSGTEVYTSLAAIEQGQSSALTPTAGKYFISYGFSGVPSTAEGSIKVTPYVVLLDGETCVYGESATYTLTAGTLTNS